MIADVRNKKTRKVHQNKKNPVSLIKKKTSVPANNPHVLLLEVCLSPFFAGEHELITLMPHL